MISTFNQTNMKAIYLIAISFMILLVSNCATTEYVPHTDSIVVLIDKTDTGSVDRIDGTFVMPMFSTLIKEPINGAYLMITLITDLVHNPVYKAQLSPEDPEYSNELTRKRDIDSFKRSVDSVFRQANKVKSGRDHSKIFRAISEAIHFISDTKGNGIKRLIILSDFHENSELQRSYKPKEIDDLQKHPERIASFIPVTNPLAGIEIFLVHQPTSQEDDKVFDVISILIKKHLVSKGASVQIVTSLNP
jgi:hypothetical protein